MIAVYLVVLVQELVRLAQSLKVMESSRSTQMLASLADLVQELALQVQFQRNNL